MDLRQKRGLIGGLFLIVLGVFGLLFSNFINKDLLSIYLSLVLIIVGVVMLGLGLIGKLPFKYTNPKYVIFAIIAFPILGVAFLAFYIIDPQSSQFYLLLAFGNWGLGGYWLWVFFAQKNIE